MDFKKCKATNKTFILDNSKKRDCHLGEGLYCPGEKNRTTGDILARCRTCRWLAPNREEK